MRRAGSRKSAALWSIETVLAVRIDDGGLITGLYAVRNAEKLSRMRRETPLHR